MKNLHLLAALAVLSFLSIPVLQAQGQERPASDADNEEVRVRVLEIHDGDLKLDGLVLPIDNLPSGLHLDGIEMTYHFSGPVTPVLEIDGEVYVLAGDRLIRMDDIAPNREFSNRANVYFLGQPGMNAQIAPVNSAGAAIVSSQVPSDVLEQAGEQAYLRQLSFRDLNLYNQIQREQSVELETFRLAGEYRRANDSDDQSRIEDALRDKLSESFELKQRIRSDEITQAEVQIDELRRLLNQRAIRKEQIIERRLLELTGKSGH